MDPLVNSSVSPIPAPGAKTAKVCGVLAILFALTCIGFPVALVLGTVALVKYRQAKRLALADPEAYLPVPATGLVTGILGLVLPLVLLPLAGLLAGVSLPALLAQRERAQAMVVQANLDLAREKAEAAVQAIHAKAPGQVASAEAIIQGLSRDPGILALNNPFTRGAPAFQRGTEGPLGTVMVAEGREEVGGVTTWSVSFRATVKHGGQERTLEAQVITHTEEKVQGHTEDGWEVVSPPPPVGTPEPSAEPPK